MPIQKVTAPNQSENNMKSRLSATDFFQKLEDCTKKGTPELQMTPFLLFAMFNFSSKCFYGNFNNSSFRLTLYTKFTPTLFILKGNYKVINQQLIVSYVIEPIGKFLLLWMKYSPLLFLLLLNCIYFLNSIRMPIEGYIAFNIFIVLAFFYSRWKMKMERKKLEMKFKRIFEIE